MKYRLVAVYADGERDRGEFLTAVDASNAIKRDLCGVELVEGLVPMALKSIRVDILEADRQE